MLMGRTRDSTM